MRKRKEPTAGSGKLEPLSLDWVWMDERKVWVPEVQKREEDDELIGEMDLAHEMEKNLRKDKWEWQEAAGFWKDQAGRQVAVFETPAGEVFATPTAPPPPPPPPRARDRSGGVPVSRPRSRSPTHCRERQTRVPEGNPPCDEYPQSKEDEWQPCWEGPYSAEAHGSGSHEGLHGGGNSLAGVAKQLESSGPDFFCYQ